MAMVLYLEVVTLTLTTVRIIVPIIMAMEEGRLLCGS